MMGAKTLEAQIADGTAKVGGRRRRPGEARRDDGRFRPALRDHARDPGRDERVAHADPYQAVPESIIAE